MEYNQLAVITLTTHRTRNNAVTPTEFQPEAQRVLDALAEEGHMFEVIGVGLEGQDPYMGEKRNAFHIYLRSEMPIQRAINRMLERMHWEYITSRKSR